MYETKMIFFITVEKNHKPNKIITQYNIIDFFYYLKKTVLMLLFADLDRLSVYP